MSRWAFSLRLLLGLCVVAGRAVVSAAEPAPPAATSPGRGCEAVPSRQFASLREFVRFTAGRQGWEPARGQLERAWTRARVVDKPPFGRVMIGSVANPDLATASRELFVITERKGEVRAFGPVATERAGADFNEGVAVARLSVVPAGKDAVLWVEFVDTTVLTASGDELARRVAFVFTARPELHCVAAQIPLVETSKTQGVVDSESAIVVSFPERDVMRVVQGRGTPSEAQRSWLGDRSIAGR